MATETCRTKEIHAVDSCGGMEYAMDKEQKKKIRRNITIGTIVGLVVVIAILVIGIATGKLSTAAFQVIACLYLAAYWAATDVLEPRLTRELEGITPGQKNSYLKYAGVDFIGYAGIMLFIVTAGQDGASNVGLLGIAAYVLSLSTKRRYRAEFLHPEQKVSPEAEEEAEEERGSELPEEENQKE